MTTPLCSAYFSQNISEKTRHFHDCHQIILILKGEVEVCVNGETMRAKSGNLLIFSRFENHALRILSNEYERYVLRISPIYGEHDNKMHSLLSNRPQGFKNVYDINENVEIFKHLFVRISAESISSAQMAAEMTELLVNELLILIYRLIPDSSYFFDNENFKTVLEVQRRFEAFCSEHYSLSEIAREYNISASSLSHQFKKITGSSVMEYLLFCRIATAKNLLTKTNLNISEIVEKCGFSDNSNFSRTFKKLNGISPLKFRQKYKN